MKLEQNHLESLHHFLRKEVKLSSVSRNEILDHACCMVEARMSKGEDFQNAFEAVKSELLQTQLNTLDKELRLIHYSKFINMKLVFIFILFSVSALHFFSPENDNEKTISFVEMNAKSKDLIDPPSLWPVLDANEVSSSFGMRMHPVSKEKKFHRGIDIPAKRGTKVMASSDGEVVKAEFHKLYGNHIVIKHDDQYSSLYSQLSSINVSKGDIVKKGDVIGAVGSSGLSTAPHLHFEVLENGKAKDPMKFIRA